MTKLRLLIGAAILAVNSNSANAAVITAAPSGSTVYPFAAVNYTGLGPQSVAPGITWSATHDRSVFGYTDHWSFGIHFSWDGGLGPMAGFGDHAGSMTFAFDTPLQWVGGFLNYANDFFAPTIAVYDSKHALIEAYTPSFSTGANNQGQFLGFSESAADISYFTLSNAAIGIVNLTTSWPVAPVPVPVPVPEPLTVSVFSAGLIGIAALRRRRKRPAG